MKGIATCLVLGLLALAVCLGSLCLTNHLQTQVLNLQAQRVQVLEAAVAELRGWMRTGVVIPAVEGVD